MAKSTLIVVGPGGVGKSPLDNIVRSDVVRLDPYRLRTGGPRDKDDRLYASQKLRNELSGVFNTFGDSAIVKNAAAETVEWYPKAGVAFFTVRSEWQCLIVPSVTGILAKMEIYAPVLPTLLTINQFTTVMGIGKILVLNPASESLLVMNDWTALEKRTEHNCRQRGDSQESIQKRINSVVVEAPYWRILIEEYGAIEAVNWQCPEYIYKQDNEAPGKAKKCLLGLDGTLEQFF